MDDAALPFTVALADETAAEGEPTPTRRVEVVTERRLVGVASAAPDGVRLQFRVVAEVTRIEHNRSSGIDIGDTVLEARVQHSAVHDVVVPFAGLRDVRVAGRWPRAPRLILEALDLTAFDGVPGAEVVLALEVPRDRRGAAAALGADLALRLAESHAAGLRLPPPPGGALQGRTLPR